jgi:hypothetical protein
MMEQKGLTRRDPGAAVRNAIGSLRSLALPYNALAANSTPTPCLSCVALGDPRRSTRALGRGALQVCPISPIRQIRVQSTACSRSRCRSIWVPPSISMTETTMRFLVRPSTRNTQKSSRYRAANMRLTLNRTDKRAPSPPSRH